MSAQHTPGPWVVLEGHRYGNLQIHARTSGMSHWIANIKCESCPAHEDGNASLIAASPDLLAACKAMLMEVNASHVQAKVIDYMRDAVAKAEGQK